MSLNYSFAGKRVLITGGGQGIGRQLVQRFHDGGAVVFTVDNNTDAVGKLQEELPEVTSKVVDLTDWAATATTIESFGVMDHLVNNAGVVKLQGFMDVGEEDLNFQYNVNLAAIINVTQQVAKGMIQQGTGGTIVNLSSIASRKCFPDVSAYGATKAAVENLTKSMALQLGSNGIRVNCILPGPVNTPMMHQNRDSETTTTVVQGMLIKRMIETDDIANLVLFLLSPLSNMIVGQGIVIDGGICI